MKRFSGSLIAALALAGCASAQVTPVGVTKDSNSNVVSNGPITFGNGNTLTLASGSSLVVNSGASVSGLLGPSSIGTTVQGYSANLTAWAAKAPYSGTLTISSGKTVAFSNSVTILGTDGSVLNFGTGGTLGSNAYTSTAFVPQTRTVNAHPLTADVTVTASDVGLGNVVNAAQTFSSVVPNTAPTSGQILIGGGTAYLPKTVSGDATLGSTGKLTLVNSGVSAGAYGDSSHLPSIVVDANGRITSASLVSLSAAGVGLGSVTNDAQTKAAVVPNTAPAAGQVLVGNSGGTAYAPKTIAGDLSLSSTGNATLANSGVTAGTYGDSSHSVTVTVDAKGRLTSAANVSFSPSTVGLSNVTNDTQTKAAVVPNTLPSAAQVLLGNSGGTAYAPQTLSGDASVGYTGTVTVAKLHGVSYGTSPSTNTVPVVTGSNAVTYEAVPNAALANSAVTISGHSVALGGSQNLVSSDVGLGSVTNDAQTKAAVVPNTAPTSGQILVGGSGSYAPQSVGGDATLSSTGNVTLNNVNGNQGSYGDATHVSSFTVNAKGLITAASNVGLSASSVGLGSVTNDAQTKAAIVPNTVPSAGQLLIGNALGTAYAAQSLTGNVTITSGGVTTITSLGTPASGNLQNCTGLLIAGGGTSASSKTAAFDNLSPLSTLGDALYFDGTHNVRLTGNTSARRAWISQTGTGSVSAAPAWANQSVNAFYAEDYGASPAASAATNTAAIQAAITAACTAAGASQNNAACVILGPGQYQINAALTLSGSFAGNIGIFGQGPSVTFLAQTTAAANAINFDASAGSGGIEIANLGFCTYSGGGGTVTAGTAIIAKPGGDNGRSAWIHNVQIMALDGHGYVNGINVAGASASAAVACQISAVRGYGDSSTYDTGSGGGSGAFIHVQNGVNCLLSGIEIQNWFKGIELAATATGTSQGNQISHLNFLQVDYGVYLDGNSAPTGSFAVQIVNGLFDNGNNATQTASYGVYATYYSVVQVTNCWFNCVGTAGAPIYLSNGTQNIISDCVVNSTGTGSVAYGINLQTAGYTTIHDNNFQGPTSVDIYISTGSDYCTIHDNTLTGATPPTVTYSDNGTGTRIGAIP